MATSANASGAALLQQLTSRNRCVRGRTWDTHGRSAIWVSGGCRGKFVCVDGGQTLCDSHWAPQNASVAQRMACRCAEARGAIRSKEDWVASQRCSVFVLGSGARGDMSDRERRHDQYGVHYWVQRSLAAHPWRVDDLAAADVVYFNGSLTYRHPERYPAAARLHAQAERLRAADARVTCSGSGGGPLFFATSFFVTNRVPRIIHPRVNVVSEAHHYAVSKRGTDLLAPLVVSRPDWLVGRATPPARVPWERRKLVFIAGHIPALYLSPLRFHIWRQLHTDPARATARHHDLSERASTADRTRDLHS